jgi:hypothetical protein
VYVRTVQLTAVPATGAAGVIQVGETIQVMRLQRWLRVAVLETATEDHSGRGQRVSKSVAITGTSAGD